MEKENVLEIKIEKMNDEYSAWCITYQNEEILKRGKFEDKELEVYSRQSLALIGNRLLLRGYTTVYDNFAISIPNEQVNLLKSKVDAINEKYGVLKRWRANKFKNYYYINDYDEVGYCMETNHIIDSKRYELGNYFKTEEEAKSIIESEDYKIFWDKVRAKELKK